MSELERIYNVFEKALNQLEENKQTCKALTLDGKNRVFASSPDAYKNYMTRLIGLRKQYFHNRDLIIKANNDFNEIAKGYEGDYNLDKISRIYIKACKEYSQFYDFDLDELEYWTVYRETIASQFCYYLDHCFEGKILNNSIKIDSFSYEVNEDFYSGRYKNNLLTNIKISSFHPVDIWTYGYDGQYKIKINFAIEESNADLVLGFIYNIDASPQTKMHLKRMFLQDLQKTNILGSIKKQMDLANAAPFKNKLAGFPRLKQNYSLHKKNQND